MEHLRNIENIEAYIKGTLPPSDKVAFEQLLSQDTALMQEVAFQRDVIQGIQSYRKAMLKAKLKDIDAQMSPFEGSSVVSSVSAGVKVASVIIVSAVVSAGAFYWIANTDENKSEQVEIIQPVIETQSVESNPTSSGLDPKPLRTTSISEAESENKSEVNKNKDNSNSNMNGIVLKKTNKSAIPTEIDKHIVEAKDELVLGNDVDTPKEIKAEINVKILSDIDVHTVDDGTHVFHYKMENQTLQLYGKFDASPYEILEFNDKNGIQIYLYYNQRYYNLENTHGKISKLKVLTDDNLVRTLESSRIGK